MLPGLLLAIAATLSPGQETGASEAVERILDTVQLLATWEDVDGDGVRDFAALVRERKLSFQGVTSSGGGVSFQIRSGATLRTLGESTRLDEHCLVGRASVAPGWGKDGRPALVTDLRSGLHVHAGAAAELLAELPGCTDVVATVPDEDGDGKVELVVNRFDADGGDYRPAIAFSASRRHGSGRFGALDVPATSLGDVDGDGVAELFPKWPPGEEARVVSAASGKVLLALPREGPWPVTIGLGAAQDADGDGRNDFYVSRRSDNGLDSLSLHCGATGRVLARWDAANGARTFAGPIAIPDRDADRRWEIALARADGRELSVVVLGGKDLAVLERSSIPFSGTLEPVMLAFPGSDGGTDLLMSAQGLVGFSEGANQGLLCRWIGADASFRVVSDF